MRPPNKNNPYAKAAGTYDTNAQAHTPDPRELEARILLKSNRMMQQLLDDWDHITSERLEETLKYNRQIWMLFFDTAMDNPDNNRPNDLRSNIVNLANFIFKRETEILSNPQKEKFNVLLNINREIAAGLMAGTSTVGGRENTPPTTPAPNGERTDISS